MFPNTFSPKLLSSSAGNGSRAPMSPSKSGRLARIMPRRWWVRVGVTVSWCGRRGQEGFMAEEGERVRELMAVAAMDSE